MVNDFEKIYSGHIQIYLNNICTKTKQQKKYLYIYRMLIDDMENSSIKIYEGNVFPEYLVLTSTGYMFIKKTKKKSNLIPILPEFEINQYKTNFCDFNTFFTNELKANTMLKLSPFNFNKRNDETNPMIVDEFNYLMELNSKTKIDINKLKTNWLNDVKTKQINNSLNWFDYIKNNCPISSRTNLVYSFYKNINNNVFKKKINFNDICVYYDIKSVDEFEIMKNIETEFEDKNQLIIFYETYNNKLKDVIKQCEIKKIRYKKIDNYSIELKWNDLNNLGLIWKITDFI